MFSHGRCDRRVRGRPRVAQGFVDAYNDPASHKWSPRHPAFPPCLSDHRHPDRTDQIPIVASLPPTLLTPSTV